MIAERNLAINLAIRVHAIQFDHYGHSYLNHVIRVATAGKTEAEEIVGWLHDVLEDGAQFGITKGLLYQHFPEWVVEAVMALTRREGEGYVNYVDRINENGLARTVKIHDLVDHLFISPTDPPGTLRRRYISAMKTLVPTAFVKRWVGKCLDRVADETLKLDAEKKEETLFRSYGGTINRHRLATQLERR